MVVVPLVTLPCASPVNAAPATVAAVAARFMPAVDAGFQPAIVPSRVAKRKMERTGPVGPGMVKSVAVVSALLTWPVGPDGVLVLTYAPA